MAAKLKQRRLILGAAEMGGLAVRMADEILEVSGESADLLLVGIRTRGVPLAKALAAAIEDRTGTEVPIGVLDITLYRDDLSTIGSQPLVKETLFPKSLTDSHLVLCDDVLYTGRTIRAALDHLVDYGRPRRVLLAVLIDRGHRELPIQADVVGKRVVTEAGDLVEVRFEETDGEDGVSIMESAG